MLATLSTPVNDIRLTPAVIRDVDAILEGPGGDLKKWNAILKVLKKARLAYSRKIKISELMVHPKNVTVMG